jgi:hypothetical protein
MIKRAWQLIEASVSLDRAEAELRRYQASLPKSATTAAERMREDKRELADRIQVTHEFAEFERLRQRMGWDIAPPAEGDL